VIEILKPAKKTIAHSGAEEGLQQTICSVAKNIYIVIKE